MNPSSSPPMAPLFNNYHQRTTNLRSKILQNEQQRVQLEEKLRFMSMNNSVPYKRKQIQHIQTYFARLNHESQRAEQRNLQLLNDLTQAQQHLEKLHSDAENLIHLKNDYVNYLEANYPNWQKPTSNHTSTNINSSNEYDRLAQHVKQQDHLESYGNLRQSVPINRQSYDVDSSMLFKRYEDQLKVGFERTISPSTPVINNEIKDQQQDEQSISESNEIISSFSRARRNGSLRMELNRTGLYFLLDYIEKELKDTIDKKKFYRLDPPTIAQKRTILDIANDQQTFSLKDVDPTTTSMVILDQLPSTVRRTTINNCLFTEDILSSNVKDLNKDIITQMLPEQDRTLWLRLVDHFAQLLKLHIMNSRTLTNKFAVALLPANVFYAHDKAKSILKHVIEKYAGTQSSNSDDESSSDTRQSAQKIVQTTNVQPPPSSSSSWLKKATTGSILYDDDDEKSTSSSSITKKNNNSPIATSISSKANMKYDDDDDDDKDFFS
ncbi:unnamed protein product [Rotaria socialis]|uniref:Centrosomal protein kizuna n=2 Tax=Rotaria socialis TaxID=392032 RepID=A0A817UJ20_9BILA|nr:unnamed protein product [Rotaria socialis]CAF4521552.1 unnamed protein product [Rotaria socialis]